MRSDAGSEVWLKADLAPILRAAWLLALDAAQASTEYQRGFLAAVAFMATALGIPLHEVKR